MSASAKSVRVTASYLPRDKYFVSSSAALGEIAMGKNNSLDSGVYGLRDSPNSALRDSPNYIHDSPNQNHTCRDQVQTSMRQSAAADYARADTSPVSRSDPSSAQENIQLPEYIIDPNTRTTYLKGKFLGKGGFARVHELTDLTNNRVYAGKIIPRSRITKPHNKEKIAREIDLHRNLRHRHVVRFEHCFEDADNVYIILEYCPRKSLVHVLKHRRTLTEPEVRYYMRQLAEASEYIHGQNIVHRDLKLGNMFISDDMQVKVGDFGLATRLMYEKKPTVCGTPNYIAPEVLDKLGHGYEADRWAMGCIMYAMLVGQPPFETETLNETYRRIRANQYTLPRQLSPAAADLIRRLLDPDPQRRPTARTMLQHDFFVQEVTPSALPTSSCVHAPSSAPAPSSQQQLPSVRGGAKLALSLSPSRVAVDAGLARSQSVKDATRLSDKPKEKESHTSIRQKLSSVFRPSLNQKKPKEWNSNMLYKAVSECIKTMPSESDLNPEQVAQSPLFITKWIDYSNKYGFGFQLSDRSVGVLFNDSTKVLFVGEQGRVDFVGRHGKLCSYPPAQVPSLLQERFTLLRYFGQYMEENLTEGGETAAPPALTAQHQLSSVPSTTGSAARHQSAPPSPPATSDVHMRRWVRTQTAIVMQLSNGTVQINFFRDHTKVIVWGSSSGSGSGELLMTYINSERRPASYRLSELAVHGCTRAVRDRLRYACTVLHDFCQQDCGDTVRCTI